MTILKAGVDTGLGTRGMFRPNADEGRLFAHLLLLPGFDRVLRRQERSRSGIGPWLDSFRQDTGYREPAGCIAACRGSERRSAAHGLALHAVGALANPQFSRRHAGAPAFRQMNGRCLVLLDLAARQPEEPEPESEEASR